jgi:hypothetical protein
MHLRAVLRESEDDTTNFSNEAAPSGDRRAAQRRLLTLTARTGSQVAGELPVQVLDISQDGLLLEEKTAALSVDDHIKVELPEGGLVRARVAWKSGTFVGCQFSQFVSPAATSAALLKADPQARELGPAPARATWRIRLGIVPELNFSMALFLALVLWGLIGLAIYTAFG